jgi:hypothetical protein
VFSDIHIVIDIVGMLTIGQFNLILRRLRFVFGNQTTSKYTYFWSFGLRVIERKVKETFDNLNIVCLLRKLNFSRSIQVRVLAFVFVHLQNHLVNSWLSHGQKIGISTRPGQNGVLTHVLGSLVAM